MIPIDEMIRLRSVGAAQKEQGKTIVKQGEEMESIAQRILDKKDSKKVREERALPPQAKAAIIIALKKKVHPAKN